jgi:hypothetical protein
MTPRMQARWLSEMLRWGAEMCADRAAIGREIEDLKEVRDMGKGT